MASTTAVGDVHVGAIRIITVPLEGLSASAENMREFISVYELKCDHRSVYLCAPQGISITVFGEAVENTVKPSSGAIIA